jgi:hypothetical protein
MENFFWLHIKKVAGNSIREALKGHYIQTDRINPKPFIALPKEEWNDNLNNYRIPLGEYDFKRMLFAKTFLYSETEFENMFKFVFVRNPYDRTVSSWRYISRYSKKWKYLNKILPAKKCYELFLEQLSKEWKTKSNRHTATHTAPYLSDITDNNGNYLVDFVGKLENIDHDFAVVCKELNIENKSLSRLNLTSSKTKHYSRFYTKKAKQIVEDLYKNDIKEFGYTFKKE